MDTRNKYEVLFHGFLDLTEFTLIKYSDGWGLYDRQGGNLGAIEEDRFESAADIFERMDSYINDYFFEDLERELEDYDVDMEGREIPWGIHEWLALRADEEFCDQNKKYFDQHSWEFDVLDMIANYADEVNLENVYYEEGE
jgi:hypothetical protein